MIKPKRYVKKPVMVEAIQLTGESILECCEFVGKGTEANFKTCSLVIHTLEGNMTASKEDYIIKGVNGEFYPCKPDIFEKTYEEERDLTEKCAPIESKPFNAYEGTIQGMVSPDYKERFRAEYQQTKIRYEKLHKIIVKYDARTLPFCPHCSIEILKQQAKSMGEYLYDLEVRAEMEQVPLDEGKGDK